MSAPARHRYDWEHPAPPSWPQFAVWFVIGPIAVGGVLAAFTPLILLTTPVSALLVVAVGSRRGINGSVFGALSGVGVGPLLVGFLNLTNSDWSPWPWLALGAVLVASGIIVHAVLINKASSSLGNTYSKQPK